MRCQSSLVDVGVVLDDVNEPCDDEIRRQVCVFVRSERERGGRRDRSPLYFCF